MNKLTTLLLILLILPVAQASYYNEIIEKGQELGETYLIDEYLQYSTYYQFNYYKKSLNEYWEERIGDCTEIARVKYIMYKSIGLKARISHGYIYGEKHDYAEYYENDKWNSVEEKYNNVTRQGRGIW